MSFLACRETSFSSGFGARSSSVSVYFVLFFILCFRLGRKQQVMRSGVVYY